MDYPTLVKSTPGLVSYWRLGEPSGTNAADEMAANNGTYVNAPTFAQTGAIVSDANTAVSFNGTDEHVSLPAGIPAPETGPWTFEVWANFAETPGTNRFLGSFWVFGAVGGWFLHQTTTSTVTAGFETTLGAFVVATTAVQSTGVWLHFVMRRVLRTLTVHVNGVQAATTTHGSDFTVSNPAGTGALGTWSGLSQYHKGLLDEAAIYNVALTDDQITRHYSIGKGMREFASMGVG